MYPFRTFKHPLEDCKHIQLDVLKGSFPGALTAAAIAIKRSLICFLHDKHNATALCLRESVPQYTSIKNKSLGTCLHLQQLQKVKNLNVSKLIQVMWITFILTIRQLLGKYNLGIFKFADLITTGDCIVKYEISTMLWLKFIIQQWSKFITQKCLLLFNTDLAVT